MTTTQLELETAAAELDELLRTETVRTRHIQLVRARSAVGRALDNMITPESDHSE
jgi:hypothetical protein